MDKKTKELHKLYYDIKQGFSSFDKFYRRIKDLKMDFTRKQVKEFYDSQQINQIFKPILPQKKFSSYIAYHPRHIYQMDIMVYDRYEYNKYKYMLVLIDVHSRFLQIRPMTNRRLETIIKNYESIIKDIGAPEQFQSDNEFNKKEFINVLSKSGTTYRFSDPNEIHKNPIVERVNRTIATILQKIRVTFKRYDWNKYVYDAVDNYNSSYHSTIKDTPEKVFAGKETNKQEYEYVQNPIQVNDKVRIIIKKSVFGKGDVLKLSPEVYIVESVSNNRVKVNGKSYKPYEVERIDNVDDLNNIEMPKTQTKNNKTKHLLKREDMKQSNIVRGKRKPVPNKKYT